MSNVSFFHFPYHGHVNPTIPIIMELVARGENVKCYATEEFRTKIEKTGAQFVCYNSRVEEIVNEISANFSDFSFVTRMTQEKSVLLVPELLEIFKKEKPDYVMYDSMCLWARAAAEIFTIPRVASFSVFAETKQGFRGFLESVSKMDPDELGKASGFAEFSEKLRSTYPVKDLELGHVFINHGDLNIVYTSKLFQPGGEQFDDSFKFVGPSILDRHEPTDFPLDKITDKNKVIYISLGTILSNLESSFGFYENCFETFRGKDVTVVISVGVNTEISKFKRIPGNFIVRNYVPQLEILKRASLLITHGGMNSVSEALYYGVPLIMIPMGTDQHNVARQVERLNAGIKIERESLNSSVLAGISEKILTNSSFHKSSLNVGESFRQAGGFERAADEIFRFKKDKGL
jgi:MGT family glycosyltransferase